MSALRVAFAGTPEFAVPALRAIAGSSHTLVGVLTQPDRPKGRGRVLTPSPVKQAALELGVPVAQPETLRTEAGRAALEEWRPDVLVVVAYGQILPPEVLKLPRLGCVNIHASLLPRWRGAAPIVRALQAGDAETGVCIMRMEAGLDTGPVALTVRTPIAPDDTAASLHDRLAELGAGAIVEVLDALAADPASVRFEPQPAEGVTYAHKVDKAEAVIDWRADAAAVANHIRAFDPAPGSRSALEREPQAPIRCYRPAVVPAGVQGEAAGGAPEPAGTVLAASPEDGLVVACGTGAVRIGELQRPGGRRLPVAEYLRGQPVAPGERFLPPPR